MIASSVLLSGLIIVFSSPIASKIQYPDNPQYIIWFALILGLDAISTIPFAELRAQNKAFMFAAVKLVNILCNIVLTLFFIIGCPYMLSHNQWSFIHEFIHTVYNPELGIAYVFIANLLSSLLTVFLLIPVMKNIHFKFNFTLWKQMLKYSLPLLIVGFAGMINETMDRILLKFYLPFSPEENMIQLGIYGACYKLSLIMTLFVQAYRMAAEPYFFSQSDKSDSKNTYALTMKYFVIACSFIFLFVMAYMQFFKYFIGNANSQYHEGLHIVPILLLANLCLGIYYNLSIWYKISDKTKIGATIAIGGACITLIVNVLFIPKYGFTASAWATLLCYSGMLLASYFSGQKYYPIPYPVKRISTYILLSLGLYVSSLLFERFSSNEIAILTFNTSILFIFALLTYILEKPKKIVP